MLLPVSSSSVLKDFLVTRARKLFAPAFECICRNAGFASSSILVITASTLFNMLVSVWFDNEMLMSFANITSLVLKPISFFESGIQRFPPGNSSLCIPYSGV